MKRRSLRARGNYWSARTPSKKPFHSKRARVGDRRAMASTSHAGGVSGRIRNAASTLCSDHQPLLTDTRRAMGLMKEIAVDLEKDKQSDMVKELEGAVVGLLEKSEDFAHFSSAVRSVADRYQPGEELTDFKKLFDEDASKLKANSSSDPKKHPLMRQFKEAVWNVHHEGQPMPGEEQEDIVMTSTQPNIVNMTCPLTGKHVTELVEPVRSMECRHVYEKQAIMKYMRSKHTRIPCPGTGCPKFLKVDKVVCDPLLLVEIDELRRMDKETDLVEDFTTLDENE